MDRANAHMGPASSGIQAMIKTTPTPCSILRVGVCAK